MKPWFDIDILNPNKYYKKFKGSDMEDRFFSNLPQLLLQHPCPKNKFGIKPLKSIISRFGMNERIFFTQCKSQFCWKDFKELRFCHNFRNRSAKFYKDGAPVIAIYLNNIINLSIKLDTYSLKCKTA